MLASLFIKSTPYQPATPHELYDCYTTRAHIPPHKKILLNKVVAVVGYVFARMYATSALTEVALVSYLVLPKAALPAICTHMFFYGVKGAISAGRSDVPSLVKGVAMAALGYFVSTPACKSLRDAMYTKMFG